MDPNDPVLCAWCAEDDPRDASAVAQSHGICPKCFERVVGIPHLDLSLLDALPFGLIELDEHGTVLRYNTAEQSLSGKSPGDVLGTNFFVDVAPCTAVKSFQTRLSAFLASDAEPVTFRFTFPFPTGTVDVAIAFVNTGRHTAFVLVKRRST